MITEPKDTGGAESQRSNSLKARVLRAGSWILVGHVLALIIRLLGNLILTRLLSPDLFGIMAIATVVQTVVSLLADVGLFQVVIQSPNAESRSFLNTAWTLQALRGWLIWSACASVAFGLYAAGERAWLPLDSVYAAPVLPAVIAAGSFSAVILGLRPMKATTVYRNLDVKRVTLIELASQLIGLSVAVLLAWITRSIWSFVISGLLASALSTLLSYMWLDGPTDRFAWDRKSLRELLHFGKWIFVSSSISVLAANGDRLLLGGWVDPTILGYYSIAVNLATVIEGAADRLFGSVSLATLSEVARREPERVPTLYFRMRWPADAAFVGTAGFLFAAGEWIVGLLYDARYAPAGPMLQILSFGLLFARYRLAQKAYVSLGRPDYEAITNVVRVISLFVLVPGLFYTFGIHGAILGIALHMIPAVLLVFWFNRRYRLNNIRLELTILCVWPLGWLSGIALVMIVDL
jgi:O-antigen/teichoic acid export membrane protein